MPDECFHHVFLEIAAHVIQKVHHEHQGFLIPETCKVEELKKKPNDTFLCCAGIEIALEPAVTSALAAEFNRNRRSGGWLIGSKDNETRDYFLVSELKYGAIRKPEGIPEGEEITKESEETKVSENGYKYSDHQKADLVAWRLTQEYETKANGDSICDKPRDKKKKLDGDGKPVKKKEVPVVIEAKRQFRYTFTNRTLDEDSHKEEQIASMARDAEKLWRLFQLCKEGYGWLLSWGTSKGVDGFQEDPDEYWRAVNDKIKEEDAKVENSTILLRWIPLKWESEKSKAPKVTRWIWVSMAEIKLTAKR